MLAHFANRMHEALTAGSEAGWGACGLVDAGELEPQQVVSEIFRRDAAKARQERLEAALPVADRLDVVPPPPALAGGRVQGHMGQPERPRARREAARRVRHQNGIRRHGRPDALLESASLGVKKGCRLGVKKGSLLTLTPGRRKAFELLGVAPAKMFPAAGR